MKYILPCIAALGIAFCFLVWYVIHNIAFPFLNKFKLDTSRENKFWLIENWQVTIDRDTDGILWWNTPGTAGRTSVTYKTIFHWALNIQ